MAETKTKKNGWGGVRKGAGRKPSDGVAARYVLSIRISAENAELVQRMKAAGVHLGMAFDTIIPELASRFGIH